MWDRRARIIRVKDGDTIVTYEDWGKHQYQETDVRLFGTFAPEKGQTGAAETTAYAAKWIAERNVGEWPWLVLYMRNKADTVEQTTFGRYVCMVQSVSTGEYLNTALAAFILASGFPRGTGG